MDCIVTSAGGVEEDLIKCLKPTYLGMILWLFLDLRAIHKLRLQTAEIRIFLSLH